MQTTSYIKSNNATTHSSFSLRNILTVACVFLLICADSAFYLVNTQTGTVRMLIDLFAILLLILIKGRISINRTGTFVFLVMLLISLLSGVMTLAMKQTIIIIAAIVIGWLFTNVVSYSDFKNLYTRIMFFLAVFSLVTFAISVIAPQLVQLLPQIVRQGGGANYYNALFSVICDSTYVSRNYGLFWEPGAFSIFLNIALFIELFQQKASIKNVAVLCLAILSTLSTLGIACMLVLVMGYVSQRQAFVRKGIKNFILFLMFCFALYLIIDGEEFIFHVLGKLKINDGKINTTTSVRIDAFVYMGKAFLSSPLWGVGYTEFLHIQESYCSGMATFTFMNLLATYGLIGGVLPIVGCFKFFWKKIQGFIPVLAMFGFTVMIFSTENFMQITLLYIMMFYGFCTKEVAYEHSSTCN